MKTLARLTLVLCAVAAPALSFAQSNAPVTRAQVRAELIGLEQAGYDPVGADDASFPADLQAAEAKIAQEQQATGALGGIGERGTSAAGTHAERPVAVTSSCIGPASFCSLDFGA